MNKDLLINVIFILALTASAQTSRERIGAGPHDYISISGRPYDGYVEKQFRKINGKIYHSEKLPSISGEVYYTTSDGALILYTSPWSSSGNHMPEKALKNYPKEATHGKAITARALPIGVYNWDNTPLELWDCGTEPSPEELAAFVAEEDKADLQRRSENAAIKEQAIKASEAKIYLSQSNAIRWLQPQATNGDASAQCSLGLHYLRGQGCETNRDQGIYWLKKSADQGNNEALLSLAKLTNSP